MFQEEPVAYIFRHEGGGSKFLQNVDIFVPDS
jgi:hypothetical protein